MSRRPSRGRQLRDLGAEMVGAALLLPLVAAVNMRPVMPVRMVPPPAFALRRVPAMPSMMLTEALDVTAASSAVETVSTLVAFADQSGKLAGTFFQASLVPYLAFLYFLGYEKNQTPKVALFGHQFLLLFVLSTVFTGIVTKGTYGSTLADVDWLHGAAEALLTTSNLYVAYGYRNAMAGLPDPEGGAFRYPGLIIFALVVAATAIGPSALGLETHSAFLAGIGNLPENPLAQLARAEPANALSIPTWAIHFSSVFEWLLAMNLVTTFALATRNEKWRGLTWGMLPLHASGVAACTYHFFYNSPDVGFLVTLQVWGPPPVSGASTLMPPPLRYPEHPCSWLPPPPVPRAAPLRP